MSIKVMTYVWEHSRHKGSELLTLLAIADHADDNGYAYPAIARLAQKTRMTERNVQLVLRKLEDSQEITIQKNKGPHGCHVFQVNFLSQPSIPSKCELCRKAASTSRRLDRHHILPRSWGGPDTLGNLMELCQECHQDIHVHLADLRRKVGMPPLVLMGAKIRDHFGEDFSFRDWAYQFRQSEKISPEKLSPEKITGEKFHVFSHQISPKPSLEPSEEKERSLPSVEPDLQAIPSKVSRKGSPKPIRSRFLPDDFVITPALRLWAAQDVPTVDIDAETAKMRDHEYKDPHSDWMKAWRNWMRRASETPRNGRYPQSASPILSGEALTKALQEREHDGQS